MAFGSFDQNANRAPMAEIDVVPLVDVMLVLLVIFIITAPLLTHAVKIDLPQAASSADQTRRENISFAIDAAGRLFWNGEPIGKAEMTRRFSQAAQLTPQPELHLRADRVTQYQTLAEVMSEAAKAGLTRIGFLTDPNEKT